MTRRELRENVFKMLFRIEFHGAGELQEQFELFETELGKLSVKEKVYLTEKYNAIVSHLDEIDAAINAVSQGWKTTRMGKVDLTLIRLAVYEIKYEADIPLPVSINEAVELAKQYGTEESASFVNGILAKFA